MSVMYVSLTQESRVSVPQRKALITRDTEGRQQVEPLVKERLEAGGRRVGWMKQVVNLLTGRTQSGHCRGGREVHRDLKRDNGGMIHETCYQEPTNPLFIYSRVESFKSVTPVTTPSCDVTVY